MILRPFLAVLITGVASAAFCQSGAPAKPVPDEILYRAFFSRVMWLDDVGRQIDAKGHDGSSARGSIRKESGLTAGEEAALKNVAQEWRGQNQAILAQIRALHAAGGASDPRRAAQLIDQRRTAVLDRMAELRALLGPPRFAVLDGYVRSTSPVRPPAAGTKSGGAQ